MHSGVKNPSWRSARALNFYHTLSETWTMSPAPYWVFFFCIYFSKSVERAAGFHIRGFSSRAGRVLRGLFLKRLFESQILDLAALLALD